MLPPQMVGGAAETFRHRAASARYREDPALWARERLGGMHLWSKQNEVGQSVVHNKKTAVKSCHAAGKTWLAAVLVCWWIDIHEDEETMVVTTAPTDHQVKKILWQYIRLIHRKFNLRGTVSEAAEWKSGDRDFIAFGRKPADTNITAFQGVHAKYVLVVVDEAGGVPQVIWDGADAITTADTNRILAIGNPDDPATPFGFIYSRQDPTWNKITIRAEDTPNFTGEEVPAAISETLITRAWVEDKQKTWGVTDRRYVSKVNAEFPAQSIDALFTATIIAKAVDAAVLPKDIDRPVLGVDIARFGSDLTVVASNYGGVCSIVDSWSKTDTVETAKRIKKWAIDLAASEVRIDGVGVGGGVVDQLLNDPEVTFAVVEMNGGGASPDASRWYNYRAFLYDHLKELCRQALISIPAPLSPDDPAQILQDELSGVRYKFQRGAMLIESKDDIRRRGGKSPDYADALTYACAPFDPDDPFAGYAQGDVGSIDAEDVIADELFGGLVIAPY